MASEPRTRVYLEAGGHVDVQQNPWVVAYMLWGRRDSETHPGGGIEPDADETGTAGLVDVDGTQFHNLRPDHVCSVAPIPAA